MCWRMRILALFTALLVAGGASGDVLAGGTVAAGLGYRDTVSDAHGPGGGGILVGLGGTVLIEILPWLRGGAELGWATVVPNETGHVLSALARLAVRAPVGAGGITVGAGLGWGMAIYPGNEFETDGGALRYSGALADARLGYEHPVAPRFIFTVDLAVRLSVPGEFAWEAANGESYWQRSVQTFASAAI